MVHSPYHLLRIRLSEAECNRLSQAVRDTLGLRHTSSPARLAWKTATAAYQTYAAFHVYAHPEFDLWSRAARPGILEGGEWREAALCYLAHSPRYMRSGYLRERVCHLLKLCDLDAAERSRVQNALLAGLEARPAVGRFRYDCRLAIRYSLGRRGFHGPVAQAGNKKRCLGGWTVPAHAGDHRAAPGGTACAH